MDGEKGKLNHIQGLFSKYKLTLKAPQKTVITVFIEVIDDIFFYRIPNERVSYNPFKKTIFLNVSGALRVEILLKKEDILRHLEGRLGVGSAPKDIL